MKYIPLDRIPIRANSKLGISALSAKSTPPGLRLANGGTPSARCCFSIQCGEVSHVLAAESPALAQRWMDKINKAWIHYTSKSSRHLTTTSMGERAVHDQSRLFAEIERWRLEAQETKMEAERRESELRLEAHEATQQARRLTSLVEDRTKYTVWVQTGSVKGSGTSAKPTICLIGTHDRSSGDLPLEATGPHRDGAFDRHVLTEFKIECGYVGDITDILIGHDSTGYAPSWFVDYVKVRCDQDKSSWRFPIGRWFDESGEDGATYRQIPAAPPGASDRDMKGSCVYFVTTYTSELRGAGTDANVFLVVHGSKGSTGQLRLARGKDDFNRGNRDQFVVEGLNVGEISHIDIGHDNTGHGPSWHLQQVEVTPEGNTLIPFPCNEWLEDDHSMRTLVPDDPVNPSSARGMVRHRVVVYTSDVQGAGTDASVFITVNGDRGESGPHELFFGKSDFKRGAKDVFTIDVKDVGAVRTVVVSQDGRGSSPSWHLNSVELRNENTGLENVFVCKEWVESEILGQGASVCLDVTRNAPQSNHIPPPDVRNLLPSAVASTMPDVLPPTRAYKIIVNTSDLPEAGTSAGVFVVMHGSLMDSLVCQLTAAPGRNSDVFKRGCRDEFEVQIPGIGELVALTVGHDCGGTSPDWHIGAIEVIDVETSKHVFFHVNRWISKGGQRVSDGMSSTRVEASLLAHDPSAPLSKFTITVTTADVRGAGTDTPVYIEIHGTRGGKPESSGPLLLNNEESFSLFDRAAVDEFDVDAPDFEVITHISLGHSSAVTGHGWRPSRVEIRGPKLSHAVTFNIDKHIPVEGKGLVLVDLKPVIRQPKSAAPITAVASGNPANAKYRVTVKTADCRGAGTKADVFITFFGPERDEKSGEDRVITGPHALVATRDAEDDAVTEANKQLFQRDASDVFIIDVPFAGGEVELIELSHNSKGGPSGWCVDFVHVECMTTGSQSHFDMDGEWIFPSQRGAGVMVKTKVPRSSERSLEPSKPYCICVHTADMRNAGTDANVHIIFHGKEGNSKRIPLDNSAVVISKYVKRNKPEDSWYDLFERNWEDVFVIDVPSSIGAIEAITIGHDAGEHSKNRRKNTWLCNFVRAMELSIEDANAMREAFERGEKPSEPTNMVSPTLYFKCGMWIGWASSDKLLERRLPGSEIDPRVPRDADEESDGYSDAEGSGVKSASDSGTPDGSHSGTPRGSNTGTPPPSSARVFHHEAKPAVFSFSGAGHDSTEDQNLRAHLSPRDLKEGSRSGDDSQDALAKQSKADIERNAEFEAVRAAMIKKKLTPSPAKPRVSGGFGGGRSRLSN